MAISPATANGPDRSLLGRSGHYLPFWKRVLDLIGASSLLVAVSPIIAVLALLISLDGMWPFFKQERLGLGGRRFVLYKLRTMSCDADRRLEQLLANDAASREEFERTCKLRHDPRVSRIGRFLRAFSLDELPQLLNVVKGDMSIVGPRPRTLRELNFPEARSHPFQAYFRVRPGITGLWQVSGRSRLNYSERVLVDAGYVADFSFMGDLRILLRTFPVVLHGQDAY